LRRHPPVPVGYAQVLETNAARVKRDKDLLFIVKEHRCLFSTSVDSRHKIQRMTSSNQTMPIQTPTRKICAETLSDKMRQEVIFSAHLLFM
jgi:hypothetical protein